MLTTVTGSVRFNVTQRDSIALRRCAPGVSSERHRPRRAQRQRLSLSHSYHPSTSDHRPDPTLLTYQFSDTATWEWWTKPFTYKDFSPYVRRSGSRSALHTLVRPLKWPAPLMRVYRCRTRSLWSSSGRRELNPHHQLGRLVQVPIVTMPIIHLTWSETIWVYR